MRAPLRQTTDGNVEERENRPLQRTVGRLLSELAQSDQRAAHTYHQLDLIRRGT